VFTAGEVLQAADVNDLLMDQSVMVFAGTAARGSAIPSPTEGMVTYLSDADELQVYTTSWGAIAGGKILQVVSGVKTDTQSSSVSAAGTVTISGLSASITPSSTASKVLVMVDLNVSSSGTEGFPFIVLRGATAISIGDASESRKPVTGSINGPVGTGSLPNGAAVILDSPNTTSSTTYTIDLQNRSGATRQAYVNRSEEDGSANGQRSASRITLMEVAA